MVFHYERHSVYPSGSSGGRKYTEGDCRESCVDTMIVIHLFIHSLLNSVEDHSCLQGQDPGQFTGPQQAPLLTTIYTCIVLTFGEIRMSSGLPQWLLGFGPSTPMVLEIIKALRDEREVKLHLFRLRSLQI